LSGEDTLIFFGFWTIRPYESSLGYMFFGCSLVAVPSQRFSCTYRKSLSMQIVVLVLCLHLQFSWGDVLLTYSEEIKDGFGFLG